MSYSVEDIEAMSMQVLDRLDEQTLFSRLSTAMRTGELADLLRLLGMMDLLDEDGQPDLRPKRCLVLGASAISKSQMIKLIKGMGMDWELFDFGLDYDFPKTYGIRKLRCSDKYRAVMVGQMPHMGADSNGASSMITEMENSPDVYPPVIRIVNGHGLKVSQNSFKAALNELSRIAT